MLYIKYEGINIPCVFPVFFANFEIPCVFPAGLKLQVIFPVLWVPRFEMHSYIGVSEQINRPNDLLVAALVLVTSRTCVQGTTRPF